MNGGEKPNTKPKTEKQESGEHHYIIIPPPPLSWCGQTREGSLYNEPKGYPHLKKERKTKPLIRSPARCYLAIRIHQEDGLLVSCGVSLRAKEWLLLENNSKPITNSPGRICPNQTRKRRTQNPDTQTLLPPLVLHVVKVVKREHFEKLERGKRNAHKSVF